MTLDELTDGIRKAFPLATVTVDPPLRDGGVHHVDIRLGHDLVTVEWTSDGVVTAIDDGTFVTVGEVVEVLGPKLAEALSDHVGAWATVTLNEASVGKSWYMHRIVGVTRWSTRERALERATKWFAAGRRAAVIPWGDDLLIDGRHMGASPELTRPPRIIEALALDTHAPQFASDSGEPGAMPNGLALGCTCGWALAVPRIWHDDAENLYAAHVAVVFPRPQ